MKVVRREDVKRGLERLGLVVEETRTKVPEWTRMTAHLVLRERTKEKAPLIKYIVKISFHYGVVNSYKFFGLPEYYPYAVKLMLERGVILNHINFYSIGVKAYNGTLHLKEEADSVLENKKLSGKERKKLHHKAMLRYHWEKQKLFASLFDERYYNSDTPSKGPNYAL